VGEGNKLGEVNGWRNSQASVLAPTGTIGFMMDCDTTGIEPDFSLVKFKKMVGGGSMQIVNQTIPRALRKFGYTEETVEAIVAYIAEKGHVTDAPGLKPEHYEVFDCAIGARSIKPMGHVRHDGRGPAVPVRRDLQDGQHARGRDRLRGGRGLPRGLEVRSQGPGRVPRQLQGGPAAVQRLQRDEQRRRLGRRQGRRCLRAEVRVEYRPVRRRLPKKRPASTTSFTVGGAQGYMISSSYPDDGLGELFLKMSKQGSTLAGMMDAFSIAVSIGLQYGVPLETYVEKFTNMRFEPAGLTDDPDVRMSASIMDYVFRRLALDHLPFETRSPWASTPPTSVSGSWRRGSTRRWPTTTATSGDDSSFDADSLAQSAPVSAPAKPTAPPVAEAVKPVPAQVHSSTELMEAIQGRTQDSPMCLTCGVKMRPAGSCYVCEGCGSTSGCS
jgi:ribonucleoside-diphosphate reductase alpha chain